jgi:nucleoside diphosphate kinase
MSKEELMTEIVDRIINYLSFKQDVISIDLVGKNSIINLISFDVPDADQRGFIYIYEILFTEDKRQEPRSFYTQGDKYYIRLQQPLKISNIDFFNCEVFEYDNENNENCLINYLKKHFPRNKKMIVINENPTYKDFCDFITLNKIVAYIFDINGKILFKNLEKDKNKNNKNIYCIIHNNHIYGIKPVSKNNKTIEALKFKSEQNSMEAVEEEQLFIKACEIIEQGFEPKFLTLKSFVHGNTQYVENGDKDNIKLFYDHLGLPVDYTKNKFNVYKDLYNMYNITEVSYFPYEYRQAGFNYRNIDIKFNDHDLLHIDMNKSYPSSLAMLPFVITCNVIYNKPHKYEGGEIIDHYLYIIKSKESNIFIPDNYMIVSGLYLNFIQKYNKAPFEIKEFITATKPENKYKNMLEKVFNTPDKKLLNFADSPQDVKIQ